MKKTKRVTRTTPRRTRRFAERHRYFEHLMVVFSAVVVAFFFFYFH